MEAGGWNIQTDYDCRNLTISSAEVKADEPVTVSATIANTFLDGSRVTLLVDGQPANSKWAWARGGKSDGGVLRGAPVSARRAPVGSG